MPLANRHTTTRDVTIGGFRIEEGTEVLPHISVILYDEKVRHLYRFLSTFRLFQTPLNLIQHVSWIKTANTKKLTN
jgi:hypothetical protein